MSKQYTVQAAKDAQQRNYGNEFYWDYLETSSIESANYYRSIGNEKLAKEMLTRTLGEALQGNDGD